MTRLLTRVAPVALAFALLGGIAPAQPPAGASAPGAAASPQVAPIAYRSRTLPNGLRVYSIRDTGTANVSVQVWYNVGSKDDPRGRSGFAHLFEHLMFKATRNLPAETFDRLTEDVGGYNNASTNDDYTNYYEVVPANHLQTLLWAEAERMSSLVVDAESFASERDVVKEELRSRVLAQPYGRLFYLYLPMVSYDVHPYARPGIGSIEDLDSATVGDVRAFHQVYYRPDNAVLVVAGNFDDAELDRWVDQYFGPIARPGTPIPRVTVEEPERTQPRHYTVYEPNTPLPAVAITYPTPAGSDPDSAVMEVLDAIVSTGDSSRLHDTLVYRDRIASQASSYLDTKQGRGMFALFAIMTQGQDAATGEAALRREVARLRDEPVSEAELNEAKNELLTQALRQRETAEGKAVALAEAVVIAGDPDAADRRLREIAAVTPADIQRVARRWLAENSSASIRYLPDSERPDGAPAQAPITVPLTVQTAELTPPAQLKIVEPAPEGARGQPPAPGPAVEPQIPVPTSQRLANGLTVVTVPDHDVPLVTAALVAHGGAAADPADRAGTANLAAAVMTEGTETLSATDLHRAVEALGSSLSSGAGWDGSTLAITVRTSELDRALGLMADVAQHAAFADEELERQRALAIDGVRVAMRQPGAVAGMVASRLLYGGGPYGHPANGTARSLAAITRADIEAAYRAAWTPAGTTLILSGDIDPATAREIAERHFGNWAGAAPAVPQAAAATEGHAGRPEGVVVVDMPGSGQAAVAVARNAVARSDPRFYPALVANTVLGGGYSARLNQEIRIRRGLSYGSRSSLDARRAPGPFAAITQTRNDAAAEVLSLTLNEMRRRGAEPIAPTELEARRASLLGDFGRDAETTDGVASTIASYVLRGVDPAEIGRYHRSVLAVTPADAQRAARDLLSPDGAAIVVVGEAAQFLPSLRRDHPNVTVIPLDQLNLDSPTLR
jgi:zinc protease